MEQRARFSNKRMQTSPGFSQGSSVILENGNTWGSGNKPDTEDRTGQLFFTVDMFFACFR